MQQQMVGIDLFSGAGGMSLGAVQAGIQVKMAVESEPHAACTYSKNHPDTTVYDADIQSLDIRKLKETVNHRSSVVLFGGPPCQGFSYSNPRGRSSTNPENWLFREFIRIARALRPDWIVIENVQGIVNTANGIFLRETICSIEKLGYSVSYELLNAKDFGVPQTRTRFFLVASRRCIKFNFPKRSSRRHVTVREAISDLPELRNGAFISRLPYRTNAQSRYAQVMRGKLCKSANHLVTKNNDLVIERYKYIREGGNWEDVPPHLMQNYVDRSRCHTGIYHRLCYDSPSVVIGNYRKNMLIHPEQDRGLSVREAARLQSFPDWYEFHGSIGFQQQQVANAVPPLLAAKVFGEIVREHGGSN